MFKKINYTYPNASKTALKDINLKIKANSIIGIIGTTGSGKTTLVDIILGLLECKEGKLEIDGNIINKNNLGAWQNSIGYVPQNIYLTDDSIASNIAFGINKASIDQKAVERVCQNCKLHTFITEELPEVSDYSWRKGYKTLRGQKTKNWNSKSYIQKS